MTRTKLPDRRQSESGKITFLYENGKEQKILITIGFDDDGSPKEVFCADFKAGTTLHSIVMDACILISRCLQHGDDPVELSASMCEGPSLIGAILSAVADSKGPQIIRGQRGTDPAPTEPPRAPDAPSGATTVAEVVA
jgi:hypothetical protein